MTAIVVLGMHRSGTSCVAGMLAGARLASAGDAVQNWDNARGHHEMLEVVRLNEAVLAQSGGHWLSPPGELRWTADHAAARDHLLRARRGGRPPLLKDPRMLLTLAFWRASPVPYRVIATVRHPLAVARSLEAWRGLPLAEGIALWTAHNRALAEDRARHGYAMVDFDAPEADVVATVAAFAPEADRATLAAAYDGQLVHHDDRDPPDVAGLEEAVAMHLRLVGGAARPERRAFPRAELGAFRRLLGQRDTGAALPAARAALAAVPDAVAVLVPVVTALVRRGAHAEARALIVDHDERLEPGVADLLHGKVLLAMGDAAGAARYLEAACAVARPMFQARHLLPQALRGAGRRAEARAAMQQAAREALYPHGPLATIAEWHWLDGEREEALEAIGRAIAAAPPHRRGRLRTRRARWLLEGGDSLAARAELIRATEEDPAYTRSRELLQTIA